MKVGPKMAAARALATENPGIRADHMAAMLGANGSRKYGFGVLRRARTAGLVYVDHDGDGICRVYPTEPT